MTLLRLSLSRTQRQLTARYLTTLGIRREDPNRIWERRVPLTPEAVEGLLKGGKDVAVEVESCKRRCFPDERYTKAGATIVPSLTKNVDIVLGIKEPPVAEVEKLLQAEAGRKRSWMVFSHTHKGQRYNTQLLSIFMDKHQSQSLIDHELLTAPTSDGSLKRVAAFGWYAGAVGAGEALSMTGLALLQRGVATPLLNLPRPYTFTSLDAYKAGLQAAGEAIRHGPPVPAGPIVIGLTGAGNVTKGAMAMLDALGVEWLKPEDLPAINERDATKVYACAVPPRAYFARDDGTYSRDDYYASPDSYKSSFSTKIAPSLTTLINGAGWKAEFPRVITTQDMHSLIQQSNGVPKLAAVQDVTCDLKGNLEFIDRHTTIDEPHFKGPAGILISAVDILPTELAKDASEHFSKCLLPYVRHITNPSSTDQAAQETLDRATIVRAGVLTTQHQWLQPRVEELRAGSNASSTSTGQKGKQNVLLLGSGLVAGPAVKVFSARPDVRLVIGSNNVAEAEGLIRDRQNVEALGLDVGDSEALSHAVSQADVVVSLLPAPMHVNVAQHCITHGKHLVTASYISPEMKELSDKAKESDIVILGECGLDPGIDSMAAMRIMDRVKREGKKVTSFVSWCGGLPEPAASNVPLGYKFSWSPKAVLTAAQNDAKFKLGGEVQTIAGQDLLKEHFRSVNLWKGLSLEGLANRDSLPYAEKYGLGPLDELRDVFRGTLRYKGFSEVLDAFREMGLLSTVPLTTQPKSWDDLLAVAQKQTSGAPGDVQEKPADEAREALQVLFDPTSAVPFPTITNAAPIDYFAALLSRKLAYLPHERDSALLHHAFKLKTPGSDREQTVTASLLCYGTDEGSAMSITVGKTLAFAALRVLDGHVKGRGVKGPYEREVWEGVLQSLEEVGVRVEEKWE